MFNRSGPRRKKYAPPKKKRVKKTQSAPGPVPAPPPAPKPKPKPKPKPRPKPIPVPKTKPSPKLDTKSIKEQLEAALKAKRKRTAQEKAAKKDRAPTKPKNPRPTRPPARDAKKATRKAKPVPKAKPKPKPKPKPKQPGPRDIIRRISPIERATGRGFTDEDFDRLQQPRPRDTTRRIGIPEKDWGKPAPPGLRKTVTDEDLARLQQKVVDPERGTAGPPIPPNIARSTSADPGLTRKGYQDRQTLQDVTEQARRGSAPISVPSLQNIRDVAASVPPPPMVSTTSVAPPSSAPTAPSVDKPGFWQKTLQSGMDALRSVVEVAGDKLQGLDRDDFLTVIRTVSPASALLIEQGLKSIPGKSDLTQMIDDVASGKIAPPSQEKPEPPSPPIDPNTGNIVGTNIKPDGSKAPTNKKSEADPEEGTPSDMDVYLKTASPESIQARIKGYKASERAQRTRDPFLDRTTGADPLTGRAAGERIATQEQAYGGGGMGGPAPTRPDMGGLSIITGDTINNPGQRVAETRRAVEEGYMDPVEGQERIEEIIKEEAEETPPISTLPAEPPPEPPPAPPVFTPPPLVEVDPFEGFGSSYIPRNIIGQSFDPSIREDYEKQMQEIRARMMQPGGNIAGSEYPVHQMPIMATPQTQFGGYGQPMPTAPLLPYSGLAAPRQPFVPFSPESKD
jgi:hypothetical protein